MGLAFDRAILGNLAILVFDQGRSLLRTGVKIVAALFGLAVATTLGALAFAWSGLGDIAASQGHWPFVEQFLDFGTRHAVTEHASGIEVPKLDDPKFGSAPPISTGAARFVMECPVFQ